jgi:predicted nucleic acid-binding Zn ribbon protein
MMRTARKSHTGWTQPQPISGILESVIASLGLTRRYHGWLVVSKWPEIVGERIAHRSKALRFDDGTLYVAVPDAVWRQELAMQTVNILREIQSRPYGREIKKLRLVHGTKGN